MVSTASASPTASTVIGYARVSTIGQTLEQQTAALTAAGVDKIFHDVMSGARDDRPGFTECMRYLRAGDTLIVWRLDRLGRNMRAIISLLCFHTAWLMKTGEAFRGNSSSPGSSSPPLPETR